MKPFRAYGLLLLAGVLVGVPAGCGGVDECFTHTDCAHLAGTRCSGGICVGAGRRQVETDERRQPGGRSATTFRCFLGAVQRCYSGPQGASGRGVCRGGIQTCGPDGWGPCVGEVLPTAEVCNGLDDDCDGKVDEHVVIACYGGPQDTLGRGRCKAGYRLCVDGRPGRCQWEVHPRPETCNNRDDDCDGKVDNGLMRACYTGGAATRDVGACRTGRQSCERGDWGPCRGEVRPGSEVCGNGRDDDCDGLVDDSSACEATIEPGRFVMGSPESEPGRLGNETRHEVVLTHRTSVLRHEVTQGFFKTVMGYNPSSFTACGAACPVERVSWWEAAAFANALSQRRGLEGCFACSGSGPTAECRVRDRFSGPDYYRCPGYRLPTEAEWEYFARAGSERAFPVARTASGARADTLKSSAWYRENSEERVHPVGTRSPNLWGLYDLSGNVWEWVFDWYGGMGGRPTTDPTGPSAGRYKVLRGGSWDDLPTLCRMSHRSSNRIPSRRDRYIGFRVVRTLK